MVIGRLYHKEKGKQTGRVISQNAGMQDLG